MVVSKYSYEEITVADNDQDFPNDKGQEWRAKPRTLTNWMVAVTGCATATSLVLITNVVITIQAIARYHTGSDGTGTIFSGDCNAVKRYNTVMHLFINVLSTLLLSSSNYCMQVINAPTRSQVDKAHSRGKWLNVGVMRLSNLRWVGWKKALIWVVLCLSSTPLHLVWNSAVFSTIGTNESDVYLVPENATDAFKAPLRGRYETLDVEACLSAYTQQFLTDRRNLGLVVAKPEGFPYDPPSYEHNTSAKETLDSQYSHAGIYSWPGLAKHGDVVLQNNNSPERPFTWICGSLWLGAWAPTWCDSSTVLSTARKSGWKTVQGQRITSCISEIIDGRCSLRFSKLIMTVVIICNVTKLIAMLGIILLSRLKSEQPLLTVGDTISSFMERHDGTKPKKAGLVSRYDVENRWGKRFSRRWIGAIGLPQFLLAYILPVGGLVVAAYFLRDMLSGGISGTWTSLSFGSADVRAIAGLPGFDTGREADTPLVIYAIVANVPQAGLSMCYFIYNRLYTSMLLSAEYDQYSSGKKALRVSRPKGFQRSKYFLSLPFRWSLPLMAGSLALHWLFSQSLFLVRVQQFRSDGQPDLTFLYDSDPAEVAEHAYGAEYSYGTRLGFTPLAVALSIVVSSILLVAGILVSLRKYKGDIPLAGSNTLAISAACHGPVDDIDGHLKPVHWGELPDTVNDPVGHCAFTSFDVVPIRSGREYK